MKRSVRTFAVLLCSLLIAASITATALAAPPEPADVDIADGSITIGDGTYTQGTGSAVTIPEDGLVITGTSNSNTITVDPGDGETAAFTISGLTLSTATGASLIYVQSGSAEITLAGVNALTGSGGTDAGALIRVSKGQTLTIKGEGSLELNNGTESTAAHGAAIGGGKGEHGGKINIESGNIKIVQYGPGAGIGGGGPDSRYITGDSGDISISGGNIDITVTAVDNYGGGCGIGPGMNYKTTPYYKYDGVLNSITISGGTVDVTTKSVKLSSEHYAGAAIGNGRVASGDGIIKITGSANVKAAADVSAAIGGSSTPVTYGTTPSGKGGAVIIDGNAVVYAETTYDPAFTANYSGAAIGQGCMSWLDWEIKIGGSADVGAYAGTAGAGIGSSFGYSQAKLSIEIGDSAKVIAYAGQYGAGIGTSLKGRYYTYNYTTISISGNADVTAVGGPYTGGAGIGSGYGDSSGNITITGEAKVTAAGGAGASAIGAGASGQVAGTTTITAGTYVEAYADGTKFAIDIDLRNDAASINVSDTVLNGRFAEDANPPVDEDDKPSTIYLLKDGEIDSTLTLPDDYRSFAVTASDGTGVIKVQNAADKSQYAYYLENDAKQIVYPLYENVDDENNFKMLTKDDLNWMSFIDVKLMDITIYTGGKGYGGAVNDKGEPIGDKSGLPEPGFIITPPEGVDVKDLTLVYDNNELNLHYEWTLEPYSPGDHDVYRFLPAGDTPLEHVYMQFTTGSGDDVTVVDTDNFDLEAYLFQTLHMKVYGESIEAGMVSFTDGTNTYPITVSNAKVTVRCTTEDAVYAGVEIEETAEGQPRIVVPEGTDYYINGGKVQVADDKGVALLFDNIIELGESDSHKDMLRDRALTELGEGNWQFEYKYLDLVDTANGNAWVKASNNVTVYWPRPENAPKDAEFTLLHFEGLHEGLHREISIEEVEGMVGSCKVTKILLTPSEDGEYLTFTVKPGGFSPFVLAWQEPDEPDEPDIPPYIPPVTPTEPEYKPDGLNTKDHFAYIIGYEDGTVRPNGSITRAEVATIFFRLLTDETREQYWSSTNNYTDVKAGDWFNNAVSTLSRMGILGGYADGTFRPDATITRAEFAKIAVSFFKYKDIASENIFTDVVRGSWYESFVTAAAEIGLIEGYEDGTFRPDASITRAEACTIINRTLGRAPDEDHLLPEAEMNVWPDNRPGAWYYADMQEATNSHEYKWLGDIEQWLEKLPERNWAELE